MNHKFNFLYKTTNTKTGQYYLGRHSTNNLNDGYLGSGYRLQRAIKKYGKENFKVNILKFLPSYDILVEAEKKLITQKIVDDPKSYNLTIGGPNPVHYGLAPWNKGKIGVYSRESLEKFRISALKRKDKFINPWLGKHHSKESKKKIGLAHLGQKQSEETCLLKSKSHSKNVYKITSPLGVILIRKNLKQFCRDKNLSPGSMNQVVNGFRNHYCGWRVEYAN